MNNRGHDKRFTPQGEPWFKADREALKRQALRQQAVELAEDEGLGDCACRMRRDCCNPGHSQAPRSKHPRCCPQRCFGRKAVRRHLPHGCPQQARHPRVLPWHQPLWTHPCLVAPPAERGSASLPASDQGQFHLGVAKLKAMAKSSGKAKGVGGKAEEAWNNDWWGNDWWEGRAVPPWSPSTHNCRPNERWQRTWKMLQCFLVAMMCRLYRGASRKASFGAVHGQGPEGPMCMNCRKKE